MAAKKRKMSYPKLQDKHPFFHPNLPSIPESPREYGTASTRSSLASFRRVLGGFPKPPSHRPEAFGAGTRGNSSLPRPEVLFENPRPAPLPASPPFSAIRPESPARPLSPPPRLRSKQSLAGSLRKKASMNLRRLADKIEPSPEAKGKGKEKAVAPLEREEEPTGM